MNAFAIRSKWLATTKGLRSSVDARLCQVAIDVGKETVTSFVGDDAGHEDHVVVPGYYLAEWIAEQWWPLLWEPRKSEDQGSDTSDFKDRHCLLAAQHGFALPYLTFTPTGDHVNIYAGSRRSELAEVRFDKSAEALVERGHVERQLRSFVETALHNMEGIDNSPLHEAWAAIAATTDNDAILFCKLIGALGLSPYEEHAAIERALDSASLILSEVQLFDLCSTSAAHEVVRNAFVACHAQQAVQAAPAIDLSMLKGIAAPADILAHPAFQAGYRGVRKLREQCSIAENDVEGADKIFQKLGLEGKVGTTTLPASDAAITGATQRHGEEGRIALVNSSAAARRFATARGAYLCWTSTNDVTRLITGAVTRDQQASRAFAAELIMPRAYVKSQATGNEIAASKVGEIADREIVAFDTVKFQAQNAGLRLVY